MVDAPAEPQEIVATPTAPFSEAPMIVLAVLFLTLLLAGVLQEAFGWLRRVAMEHATEGQ